MKKHLIIILLLAISITLVGAQEKDMTEKNTQDAISKAELDIQKMRESGFGIVYVSDRLTEARNALQVGGRTNYVIVFVKTEEISERKESAYRISDSLRALRLRIDDLKRKGLDTAGAEETYSEASDLFEKENLDEAEELVFHANKDLSDIEAEHTVLRARYSAARDNTLSFIKDHWIALSIALVLLLVFGFISYDKYETAKTRQRLKDMELENKVLVDQMKKAQIDYFNKGLMSRESYEIKMRKYRKMLLNVDESIPVLRARLKNQ